MTTAVTPAPEREGDDSMRIMLETYPDLWGHVVQLARDSSAETQKIHEFVMKLGEFILDNSVFIGKLNGRYWKIEGEAAARKVEVYRLKVALRSVIIILLYVIIILCGVLSELIKVKQAIVAEQAKF
ncbi:hypothetical protein ACHAWC_001261 [Mediolabrus comicus]